MFTKDAFLRAVRTAVAVFIGLFATSLLGAVGSIVEWANDALSNGAPAEFPDLSWLGFAVVSAAGSAVSGIVTFIINGVEDAKGVSLFGAKAVPAGTPPQGGGMPLNNEAGQVSLGLLALIGVIILVILLLTGRL